MNKTFIFDLDDTLIFNQHYYSLAQLEFVKFVYNCLGPRIPSAQSIIDMEVKRDIELVKSKGFTKDRFPTSFAETYKTISEKMGEKPELREQNAQQAYRIGERVFDSRTWFPNLVPKASDTLEFLVSQGDELRLLTTGDESVQQSKIDFYEISRWFGDRIHIVPNHKKEKMAELVTERDKRRVWFVGNSAKSDIAPALEIGIGAVYIPQETWAYDQHDLSAVNKARLITLNNINELPKIYSEGLK